jgi:hypothetical protein
MSWKQFEKEVAEQMEIGFKSPDDFARFFTDKYDECVKRGVDFITLNPVSKGNKDLMYSMIQIANLTSAAALTPALYDLYFNMLGDAVVGYWSGATSQKIFIPLIPATGTFVNIGVKDNIVTFPGKWPRAKVRPMKNVRVFLKTFTSFARMHLITIKGLCTTVSLYPPLPGIVGDGVIQWTGYKVVEPKKRYITDVSDVYEIPNETSTIVHTFEKGLEVDTQKINDIWVYAKDINNRGGFVKKEFITNKTPN